MSVTSPPRPPRPSVPLDQEELEALVEALIEEARRRAGRRRRRIGLAVLLAAGAGIAAFIGFGGRNGGGAGAVALARSPGAQSRVANTRPATPLGNLPGNIVVSEAIAFDTRIPNTVYVAAMGSAGGRSRGYVFKTTDRGWHWRSTATTGAGWTRADALTADPRYPGTLYAGNVVAVYKTIDGGRSWHPWNQGLFPPPGPLRKQHFGTPGTTSWNRDEGWVTDIVVDPADSSIVYSATDAVRKSSDGGHTWKTVFRPVYRPAGGAGYVQRIAIAPTRPETIYAMAMDARDGSTSVYKSSDAGASWHATGGPGGVFPKGDGGSTALAVDPLAPTTVYAAIDDTILRTTDAGASWRPIMHGLSRYVVALAVDPQRSGTVYAGLYPGGIFKTTNGGRTWSRAVSGVSILALAVDPARPTTIYAAGSDKTHADKVRILRSTDSGRTWTISP